MKKIFKIWIAVIFMVIAFNSFSQNPASASSLETGYWNYEMNQYEADSYSLNKTKTMLVHQSDSFWKKIDSIRNILKYSYSFGHNFKTVNSAVNSERYYVYMTDSTFEITNLNIANTADKLCLLRISLGQDMIYRLEEDYNASCGLYYMAGDSSEVIYKLMDILNKIK